jgi:hypothetical protein
MEGAMSERDQRHAGKSPLPADEQPTPQPERPPDEVKGAGANPRPDDKPSQAEGERDR